MNLLTQLREMFKKHKIAFLVTFLLLCLITIPSVISTLFPPPMIVASNRFHPNPDWKKAGENYRGANSQSFMNDIPKDSMWRAWDTQQDGRDLDLKAYAIEAGYTLSGEPKCEDPNTQYSWGSPITCSVRGTSDGYNVEIRTLTYEKGTSQVQLTIAKNASDL